MDIANMETKLYVLVRGDLSPGLQTAQAVHAALQLCFNRAQPALDWHTSSNNVVVLNVENEAQLDELFSRLRDHDPVDFREPDIGNARTAVAVLGNADVRRTVRQLPLALAA